MYGFSCINGVHHEQERCKVIERIHVMRCMVLPAGRKGCDAASVMHERDRQVLRPEGLIIS